MFDCPHERTEIRWRNRAAGLIGRQCLECGANATGGGWVPHAEAGDLDRLAAWAEVPDAAGDRDRVPLAGPRDRAAQPRYVDRAEYELYLGSELWRRRRDKVMERAAATCEGCLTRPATDVHHLTYRHLYAEFAFELVALCRACHERVHAEAVQSDAAAR